MNLKEYFESVDRGDYQRENFDDFLKKVSFDYSIPSIHIAGSNGKGTTANYLANIYRAHGLKVGLYTSPFLDNVNEMIRQLLPAAEFLRRNLPITARQMRRQ